ncbi:MAG: efflux RND transporter periplasmic adaptor subunit [Deltaproteobacteria bacterium]|nr:MAG: efflux RND transporter periplasmic adaptor subunit [Deltaproteobacteria bacterium]
MTSKANLGPGSDHPTFTVMRGPLRISVIESGTITARKQVVIKNEVEGRTSIIYLIPEGTRVKKGQLLVELDASKLLDEKVDQQIRVKNTEAAFVGARENLEVVRNQAEADVDKARLVYNFAVEDLKKYLEGEYPNQLKEAESKLTLAKEEVTRAQEKVEWSRRLFQEKYISNTELTADELTLKKNILNLELAENDLDLLKKYTHKRRLAQLESDVKQAKMALDRTIRKAKADVVQAESNLEAKKAEFQRQQDKLKKIEIQIEKTKIYAPNEGLVVHATSASSGGPPRRRMVQPLEEGQEVRERQELIHLPTTSSAKVEVAIHEANLDKVRVGLPVKVTVDAIPDDTFWGKVATIAPLPDARSAWLNPDLKVYNTDIYLENNSDALRTGMSCKAEIIIEQHQEATYVPVQAVLRVGGRPTVHVLKGNNLEPRTVEIGLDNNRMVRIIGGLEPGEVVSLTPPLAAATVEPAEYSDVIKTDMIPPTTGTKPTLETIGRGASSERRPEEKEARGGIPGSGVDREGNRAPRERTPEQEEKRKQFLQSLSPEERERFRNMSPEEKRRFRNDRMGS